MEDDARLPTGLWLEAKLREMEAAGVSYYVTNKGAYAGGMVMLKLNGLKGVCRLLIQQRDIDGVLGWIDALDQEQVEEKKADDYIRRSIARDPDVWAIEIEDRAMKNPFVFSKE